MTPERMAECRVWCQGSHAPVLTEALDEIESLQAERDELQRKLDFWLAKERDLSTVLNLECYSITLVQDAVEKLLAERDELLTVLELLTRNKHDAVSIERCEETGAYKWLVTASWVVGDELDHTQGNSDSLLEALSQAIADRGLDKVD